MIKRIAKHPKKTVRASFYIALLSCVFVALYQFVNLGTEQEFFDRLDFVSGSPRYNAANLHIKGALDYRLLNNWDDNESIESFRLLPSESAEIFVSSLTIATQYELDNFGCPNVRYYLRKKWPAWIPKDICDFEAQIQKGLQVFYRSGSGVKSMIIFDNQTRHVIVLTRKDEFRDEFFETRR